MDFKFSTPTKNAFNTAAREGGKVGLLMGAFALLTGAYDLAIVATAFSFVAAHNVAHRYESKAEKERAAAIESRRPSEGPGW